MRDRYILDAVGIFAFFQMDDPDAISNLNISKELETLFYQMLLKQIDVVIPVPAMSEFMYKMYKHDKIEDFKDAYEEFKKNSFEITSFDAAVLTEMTEYIHSNKDKIKHYFRKKKKSLELFDLIIYIIARLNKINKIISKDAVFSELYQMNRFW